MSQENVELVKSVHPPSGTDLARLFGDGGAAGQDQLARLASLLTDDFVVVGGENIGGPGLALTGHGIAGLLAVWRDWLGPWETYRTEVEDFVIAPGDRVVVLVRDHGRLHGSDAEVDIVAASVWTLRGGRIARIEFHTSRAHALSVAGLQE